jgi:hypothetical protein
MLQLDLVLVETPSSPAQGVAVFLRDPHQEVRPDHIAAWQALLNAGRMCIALRPGSDVWDTAEPASLDRTLAQVLILQLRTRVGLQDAPAFYLGFGQGAEAASTLGLADPTAQTVALIDGAGTPMAVANAGPRVVVATANDSLRAQARAAWEAAGAEVMEVLPTGELLAAALNAAPQVGRRAA